MKLLIGSTALAKYIEIDREPKDIDYFVSDTWHYKGLLDDTKVEVFSHPKITEYFGDVDRDATLDELYTIKISHSFWELKNGSWNKHCYDIMRMKDEGAEFIRELYDVLYSVWEEVHGKKKANLNASPEDFFKNTVTRIYDHDSIHDSVAYYDKPLFNVILADGHQVKVDRSKFEDMDFEDKLKLVREEVYATALERQLIPSDYKSSPRAAYLWALRRTITSFSKGWFPLFIVLNLDKLWSPDINYVYKHKQNSDKLIKLEGAR